MRWGPHLQALRAHQKQTKGRIPALERIPALQPEDAVYYNGFMRLSAGRTFNMGGPNPIAVSEVLTYAREIAGIEGRDGKRLFLTHVQAMDGAYLEHQMEQSRRSAPPSPTPPHR